MTADSLLDLLPRLVLVVGKGGVGKSTTAAALAIAAADRGERTLLLTTDPAHALGRVLDHEVGATPAPVAGVERLDAAQPDVVALREAFLARWREILVTIVDRGTYLAREDIGGIVDAALPGSDEIFGLLELARLARDGRWTRIVVDTAPTGHTLRFLALPRAFEALLSLLDTMQEKHRFMVRTLTRRYRRDAADEFIVSMRAEVASLGEALTDPARGAAVVVTRAEPLVAAETARLVASLGELGVAVGAVVGVGQAASGGWRVACDVSVPLLPEPPVGVTALRGWGERLQAARGAPPEPQHSLADGKAPHRSSADRTIAARHPSPAAHLPRLTIVAGKGGVGKTTVAGAIAAAAAAAEHRVLVVSTDPAPSLGDAFGLEIGDRVTPVPGRPGLHARQMDAGAAFARFRDEYRARIDAALDGLLARGVDATHDRAVLRELLSLAPPGIDELYALSTLGELLEAGEFEAIVVDPAPTGHLLRLLELPALAIEWAHRLMRLMLRYPELGAAEGVAEELLGFTRRTKALQTMLCDVSRAGVVLVALDEPVVRGETERLAGAIATLGIELRTIVWNRATGAVGPLSSAGPVTQLLAPEADPAPAGAAALVRWMDDWTPLTPTPLVSTPPTLS